MDKPFLLAITHSTDDAVRASSALALANAMLAQGSEIIIFLLNEGVLLGQTRAIEGLHVPPFPPVKEMVNKLTEAKVKVYL